MITHPEVLTVEQLEARSAAYDECVDHLNSDWTQDPIEKQAGKVLSNYLRHKAAFFARRAQHLKSYQEHHRHGFKEPSPK